ncbi:MAG: glycosyltransferase 87 family protein, partial [Desulfobacterales bacterium]
RSFALPFRPVQMTIVGLGLLSGVIYFYNFRLLSFFAEIHLVAKSSIHFYVFLFLVLSLFYLFGIYLVFKYRAIWAHSKSLVPVIILFAVLFRAFLVPADPAVLSGDMYRYIWDGRVQQNGINPYQYPPDADELKSQRDDHIYPHINRKSYPTLYPAGAQLFFRFFHIIVGDNVSGYKGLMTLFDVATLFVLLALLRVNRYDGWRLLIYAWNPLVIFEIAYSGHLEGLTVFWMVLACYLSATDRQMPGVAALAVSSAIKLYPALLLPALLNRGQRIKGCLAFAVTILLLYVPFLGAGRKILGFLPTYLQNPYESFNLGLKSFMMQLLPQIDYALWSIVFLLGLAVAGLYVFFKDKHPNLTIRYAFILLGLLVVLMPASLHPWYVIIVIPFLCFYPAVAWLLFSCLVTLSYLKYGSPKGIMPAWILMLEYAILCALLAGGAIIGWTIKTKRDSTFTPAQNDIYLLMRL